MKSFKKVLCLALAAVFVFLFAACGGGKKKAEEEKQQKTEPKTTYTERWLLSPSIKAQSIYTLPIASLNKSTNHYDITFGDSFIVKKGDMFGLIDSNGSLVFEPDFLSIETCPCYDGYIITQKESGYTSTYQLSSKYQKAWIYPHECEGFNGLSYTLDNSDMTVSSEYTGKDTDFSGDANPVVPESMPVSDGQKLTGKYTLVTAGKAVGRSDYDCAGVFTGGLCAFRLNGKWGYVNAEGKTVIPFEFDAVQGYNALNKDFDTPYECSEGYVTVLKGGKFGVYSAEGKMVIPCQYACLTTVHDGRAYASQDGQTWGILLVDEKISNGISAEEKTTAATSAQA